MLDILILTLATWRVSSLLASEAGPWDVFGRLRHRAGVRYGDDDQPYGTNQLARGLLCVWCCSLWIGAGLTVCHYLFPAVVFWLALPFALSAGAVIVEEVTHGDS